MVIIIGNYIIIKKIVKKKDTNKLSISNNIAFKSSSKIEVLVAGPSIKSMCSARNSSYKISQITFNFPSL